LTHRLHTVITVGRAGPGLVAVALRDARINRQIGFQSAAPRSFTLRFSSPMDQVVHSSISNVRFAPNCDLKANID
jgi:hypothetical protein